MKILCRNTPQDNQDIMFDTNFAEITVKEWHSGKYMLYSGQVGAVYAGSEASVRKVFNEIIAAEKRGDTFLEIGN